MASIIQNALCALCDQHFNATADSVERAGQRIPVVLSCGHASCCQCLRSTFSAKKNKAAVCGVCEKQSPYSGELKDLRHAFPYHMYLLGLFYARNKLNPSKEPSCGFQLRQVDQKKKYTKPVMMCRECDSSQASFSCKQCKLPFCDKCFVITHQSSKIFRSHEKEDLHVADTLKAAMCKDHQNYELDMFCQTCEEFACMKCCILKHPNHTFVPTTQKNEEVLPQLKTEFDQARDLRLRCRHSLKEAQELARTTGTGKSSCPAVQTAERQLAQHLIQLHGLLQRREAVLLERLHVRRDKEERVFVEIQDVLETGLADLESAMRTAQVAMQPEHSATASLASVRSRLQEAMLGCRRGHLVRGDVSATLKDNPDLINQLCEEIDVELSEDISYWLASEDELPPTHIVSLVNESDFSDFDILTDTDSIPDFLNSSSLLDHSSKPPTSSCSSLASSSSTCSPSLVPAGRPIKSEPKSLAAVDPVDTLTIGSNAKVTINHVVNPSKFYAQLCSSSTFLLELSKCLLKASKTSKQPSSIEINNLYMVKYDEDGEWYRGRVEKTDVTIKGEAHEVFFVDYGNVSTVGSSKIKCLPVKYASAPSQAIECGLYHINPAEGKWEEYAIKHMVSMADGVILNMHILDVTPEGKFLVDLSYGVDGVDCSTSIRDSMIFLGAGTFQDASIPQWGSKLHSSVKRYVQNLNFPADTSHSVAITHLDSPSNFYVQRLEDVHLLEKLMPEISEFCSNADDKYKVRNPFVGMPCLAFYTIDGYWYRAVIEKILEPKKVLVHYIDYGNKETVLWNQVMYIPDKFFKVAKLAYQCSLADVAPNGEQWSHFALFLMKDFQFKKLEMLVDFKEDQKLNVILIHRDKSADICVNSILVDSGHAVSTNPRSLTVKYMKDENDLLEVQKENMAFVSTTIEPQIRISDSNQEADDFSAPSSEIMISDTIQEADDFAAPSSEIRISDTIQEADDFAAPSSEIRISDTIQEADDLASPSSEIRISDSIQEADHLAAPSSEIRISDSIQEADHLAAPSSEDETNSSIASEDVNKNTGIGPERVLYRVLSSSDSKISEIKEGPRMFESILCSVNEPSLKVPEEFCCPSKSISTSDPEIGSSRDKDSILFPKDVKRGSPNGKIQNLKSVASDICNSVRKPVDNFLESKKPVVSVQHRLKQAQKSSNMKDTKELLRLPVEVLSAESPSCVFVTIKVPGRKEAMTRLHEEMCVYYEDGGLENESIGWMPSVTTPCAVKSSINRSWFRGVVIEVLPNSNLKVMLKDEGSIEEIDRKDVRKLAPSFKKVSDGTIKCHLSNVKAAGSQSDQKNPKWSSLCCETLNELVNKHHQDLFISKKGSITEDRSLPVELWVCESIASALAATKEHWFSINRRLVEDGAVLPIDWKAFSKEEDLPLTSDDMKILNPPDNPDDVYIEDDASSTSSLDENETVDKPANTLLDWLPAEHLPGNFLGMVTYVDMECNVYLHDIGHTSVKLHKVNKCLDKTFSHSSSKPEDNFWFANQLCIVKYHLDSKWYRGKVLKVEENHEIVLVMVDYGNVEDSYHPKDLRKNVICQTIPVAARKCRVNGLMPVLNDKWCKEMLNKVYTNLVEKECIVDVIRPPVPEDDVYIVNIIVKNKGDIKDIMAELEKEHVDVHPSLCLGLSESFNFEDPDVLVLEELDSSDAGSSTPANELGCEIKSSHSTENDDLAFNYPTSALNLPRFIPFEVEPPCTDAGSLQAMNPSEDKNKTFHYSDFVSAVLKNRNQDKPIQYSDFVSTVLKSQKVSDIPIKQGFLDRMLPESDVWVVNVPAVLSATEVVIHILNIPGQPELNFLSSFQEMFSEMQLQAPLEPPLTDTKQGSICSFLGSDGQWYRGEVRDIDDNGIHVKDVDGGTFDIVPSTSVRKLAHKWLMEPIYGIECQLDFNVPIDIGDSEGLCEKVFACLCGKQLEAVVVDRNPVTIKLYCIDSNTKEKTTLAYQELLDKGLLT